ncbi:unnamed protein product [Rhizopus stolonifer]
MYKKFAYFDTKKRSAWNTRDASDAFKKAYPDLTIEQQLAKFHERLKKEDNKVVKSWLTNWTSFHKQAEKAKTIPANTSNSSSINIDMKESTNHGFYFGNVNNFYEDNHKKRELEDHGFENPSAKRIATTNRPSSDRSPPGSCPYFSYSAGEAAASCHTSFKASASVTHVIESDSLSESPASDCTTEQPAGLVTDQPIINSQDDIWACWRLHLNDNSLHKYSLERLGIIQCGNKIQCRDCYPSELYDLLIYDLLIYDLLIYDMLIYDMLIYDLLIYDPSTSVNPVSNNAGIFDLIFDEVSNKSLMSRKLYQIAYEDKQDPQVFAVTSVLEILTKSVFASVCVTDEEANYSHYVIWPLLDTIIATVDELKFHCGEYRLRSVDKELSQRNIRSNEYYKSDGCISTLIDGARIELVLLEVSGPFKLDDESRFVKDHVKAGYGLIAMLNEIA